MSSLAGLPPLPKSLRNWHSLMASLLYRRKISGKIIELKKTVFPSGFLDD
jgi:hypothetical protein